MPLDPSFFQGYVQPTPEPWRYSGALGSGIRQAVALAEQIRSQRAREKLAREDMAQQRELAMLSEAGATERTKIGTLDVENLREEHRLGAEGRVRATEREERKRIVRGNYLEAMSRGDYDAADMWVAEGEASGLKIHGAEPVAPPPPPMSGAEPQEPRGYAGAEGVQGQAMAWLPGMAQPRAVERGGPPTEELGLKPMDFGEERAVPEGYVAVTDMDTGESQWVKVAGFRQRKADRIEQIRQVIRPYMDADEQAVTQVASELEARYPGTPAEDFKQFESLLQTLLGGRLNRKRVAARNAAKVGGMRSQGTTEAILATDFNAISRQAENDFNATMMNMKAKNLGSDLAAIDSVISVLSKRGTEWLAAQNGAIFDIVTAKQGSRPTDMDFQMLSGLGSVWDKARTAIAAAKDDPQLQDMQLRRVMQAAKEIRKQLVAKKYEALRTAVDKYNTAPSEVWRDAYAARMYSIFEADKLRSLGVNPPRKREERHERHLKRTGTYIHFSGEQSAPTTKAPAQPAGQNDKSELDLED